MAVDITPNPNVVGPTGPTGPTGSTGPTGATGASGTNLAGFNAQTGTTYTLVIGDKDKLVTCSNASAITVTVPRSLVLTTSSMFSKLEQAKFLLLKDLELPLHQMALHQALLN
jgi:hypothetical protein